MTNWGPGYSDSELRSAQERFGLQFPPDLFELLRATRLPGGHDWNGDEQKIKNALDWPYEGLLFDVEENSLWWPEWGERPSDANKRAAILRSVVEAAPRLIPIYSHRYIAETPQISGNPVFSVYQSDVIYYGRNLDDYLSAEFGGKDDQSIDQGPIRHIRFWSDLVDRNGLSEIDWP